MQVCPSEVAELTWTAVLTVTGIEMLTFHAATATRGRVANTAAKMARSALFRLVLGRCIFFNFTRANFEYKKQGLRGPVERGE